MAKDFVRTISSELVARQGLKVIATTHSISTVALAPDESVFLMLANPPRLQWVGRDRALTALSAGVPTLSLSYDGRLQVLCESEYDKSVYSSLFQGVRRYVDTEKSLEFVAVGTRGPKGDLNSGSAAVRSLVKELSLSGNTSVLGVVDWDGAAAQPPQNRVFVLSLGLRDGLENYILDPLTLLTFIVLKAENLREAVGIPKDLGVFEYSKYDEAALQPLVDGIVKKVLGSDSGTETVVVSYCGGLRLRISRNYLAMDDHELANRVLGAFELREFTSGALAGSGAHGKLMSAVATSVGRDFASHLATDVVELFRAMVSET